MRHTHRNVKTSIILEIFRVHFHSEYISRFNYFRGLAGTPSSNYRSSNNITLIESANLCAYIFRRTCGFGFSWGRKDNSGGKEQAPVDTKTSVRGRLENLEQRQCILAGE